jgi:hypothetical protein
MAFATGRPWELREHPTLSTVRAADATISLPHLMGGTESEDLNANPSLSFGSLRYDPMVVSLFLVREDLSAEQLADPEATLRGGIDELAAPEMAGFTVYHGTELSHREGRPYLHFIENAADGRAVEGYWFIEGGRLARVMVFTSRSASQGWRDAAQELAFTLQRPQPARSPNTHE